MSFLLTLLLHLLVPVIVALVGRILFYALLLFIQSLLIFSYFFIWEYHEDAHHGNDKPAHTQDPDHERHIVRNARWIQASVFVGIYASRVHKGCRDKIEDEGSEAKAGQDYTSRETLVVWKVPPTVVDRYDVLEMKCELSKGELALQQCRCRCRRCRHRERRRPSSWLRSLKRKPLQYQARSPQPFA